MPVTDADDWTNTTKVPTGLQDFENTLTPFFHYILAKKIQKRGLGKKHRKN
jgi:hypothetical protein